MEYVHILTFFPYSREYVPDGLSKEQWKKIKQKEKEKNKNLKFNGTSGMKFRSRSMAEFLEGREKGLYKYNMVWQKLKTGTRKTL